MEFKSICIKNFLPYFESNEIEFAPTTTIIIGQNDTGKSKIFDAINFVIYERIFISDKGENGTWEYTDKEIAKLILNTHKINEALQNDENKIETSVCLLIEDGNKLIKIERSYNYKRFEKKFDYIGKDFTLSEIDPLSGDANPYTGDDAEDKIKQYFADSIKDFFLFQGEAASRIMQLQKGGNFSKAVREIARLEIFEEAKEIATKYNETTRRKITMKTNKNKKIRDEQEELQFAIENENETLQKYIKREDEANADVAQYSEKLENLETELSSLKEFEEYFKQKKQIEENSKRIQLELDNANAENSEITEDAVFYKVKEKIESFKSFYSKLEKKGEVPPSIPAAEIRKALNCCRCTICNTDLSEGTAARNFAESRLPKCDTDKLGSYLRDLNATLNDISDDVKRIPETLKNLIESKRKLEDRKKSLIQQKKQTQDLLASVEIDPKKSIETIQHIEAVRKSINNYTTLLNNARTKASESHGSQIPIKNIIFRMQQQLNTLIVGDDEIDIQDKIIMHYASKLDKVMTGLAEVAKNTAYGEVQKRANEYYKEMTKENADIVGDVKIDLETSEIYTVDEEGNRIRNINQGNRISIQLSVIAGILTVAQEQFSVRYPFVTDAPVSALGGDNKLSTIKTMINAFEQSIIIIKDDSSTQNKTNDEIRNLIKTSSEVGIAYELSLSESESKKNQFTEIKKIKG